MEIPNRSVNWDKIAKDNIPGMDFTFWTWFYNAMKLIKDKFSEHWRAGYVIGFIHKDHAKALLEPLADGTFLFRFSESSYGHMSIDVALDNYPRISSCGPFSEFKMDAQKQNQPEKSLNQFISDFVELLYLYPGIPKSTAFPKESTPFASTNTGYKKLHTKLSVNSGS